MLGKLHDSPARRPHPRVMIEARASQGADGRVYVSARGFAARALNNHVWYYLPELTQPPLPPHRLKKLRQTDWLSKMGSDSLSQRGVSVSMAPPADLPPLLSQLNFKRNVIFLTAAGQAYLQSWLEPLQSEIARRDNQSTQIPAPVSLAVPPGAPVSVLHSPSATVVAANSAPRPAPDAVARAGQPPMDTSLHSLRRSTPAQVLLVRLIGLSVALNESAAWKSAMADRGEALLVGSEGDGAGLVVRLHTVHIRDKRQPLRGISAHSNPSGDIKLSFVWYSRNGTRFPAAAVAEMRAALPLHERENVVVTDSGDLVINESHLDTVVLTLFHRFASTGMCDGAGTRTVGDTNGHLGVLGDQHLHKDKTAASEILWSPPTSPDFAINSNGDRFALTEYTTNCELFVEGMPGHQHTCKSCQAHKPTVRSRAHRFREFAAAGDIVIETVAGPVPISSRANNHHVRAENLTEVSANSTSTFTAFA